MYTIYTLLYYIYFTVLLLISYACGTWSLSLTEGSVCLRITDESWRDELAEVEKHAL
jgi:hypothetical protein